MTSKYVKNRAEAARGEAQRQGRDGPRQVRAPSIPEPSLALRSLVALWAFVDSSKCDCIDASFLANVNVLDSKATLKRDRNSGTAHPT